MLAAKDVLHTTTTTAEVGVPQLFTPPQVSGRATARPTSTRAAAGVEAVGSPGSPQSAALDASMLPGLWSAKLTISRPSSPTGTVVLHYSMHSSLPAWHSGHQLNLFLCT